MGFLICTSYPHPFIFSMLFGKILPILKPRFYEYFSNQLRSQWFPSSHFLLHVFAAPVLQHSPCFNSLTISLCLSSYLRKGPCPPSESMHWLIYCWLNLIPHFFFWPHCVVCGILVLWPAIEPVPPAVETRSLNHWTAREVPLFFILNCLSILILGLCEVDSESHLL